MKKVVGQLPGVGGRGSKELLFSGDSFSWEVEKALEIGGMMTAQ